MSDYNYQSYDRMGMVEPIKKKLFELYDPMDRPPASSRHWSGPNVELIEVPGFGAVLFQQHGDVWACAEFTNEEIKPTLHDKE